MNTLLEMESAGPLDPVCLAFITERWFTTVLEREGVDRDISSFPRILARDESSHLRGLATYAIDSRGQSCEIITLDAVVPGQGVGKQILAEVEKIALDAGCRRVWLITTSDNVGAVAFCLKHGYRLLQIRRDRTHSPLKPKLAFGLIGHGLSIGGDAWEFEKKLHESRGL